MEKITWKKLNKYPDIPDNLIEVSNTAKVRYIKTKEEFDQIISGNKLVIKIEIDGKTRLFAVARLFAFLYLPLPKIANIKDFHIKYLDDNINNISVDNLIWLTSGGKTYQERKDFLDFVASHKHLTPKQSASVYYELTGRTILPQIIQNIYLGKCKDCGNYGHTIADFLPTYKPFRLSQSTVEDICKALIITNGNIKNAHKLIQQTHPEVTRAIIQKILYKVSYARISDNFFEYYGKNEFVSKL